MAGFLDDLIADIKLDTPQPQPAPQPAGPQPAGEGDPAQPQPSGGDVGNSLYGDQFLEHYGLKK